MKPISLKYLAINQTFSATLPLPPTSNHRLFPINGRLVKAKANRNYQKDIASLKSNFKPFIKPVGIEIVFYRPRLAGDIDGRIKTLFDALSGIIYEDDGQIEYMSVWNKKDKDDPRVELVAYEL